MAQRLPKNFEAHVEGRTTALVPVVFIGDSNDYLWEASPYPDHGPQDIVAHSGLMLSTQPIKVGGEDHIKWFNKSAQCYPLLKDAPKIKEKIDLKRRKYRINDVTIRLFKGDYDGEPISNHPMMSTLMNAEMRMWWVYPPYEFCNIPWTDSGEAPKENSGLLVYRGMVRDVKETKDEITITVEDRSQDVYHRDVPTATLPGTEGMRGDMKLKPVPICYGYQKHAPYLVYSGDEVDGYVCMPDRSVAGLFTREEDETVMLSGDNTQHDVWIDIEDAYVKCQPTVYHPAGTYPGSLGTMYYGNNFERYPGYFQITKLETPLYNNPDDLEEITGYALNPPADNAMQIQYMYRPTVVEPFTSEDDYQYIFWGESYNDGAGQVYIKEIRVHVHHQGTDNGLVDGEFDLELSYDGVHISHDNYHHRMSCPYHSYRRKIRYSFPQIENHKQGSTVYERFRTGTWWMPEGWQLPSWGGTPADPDDDYWSYGEPKAEMWEIIPNHVQTQPEYAPNHIFNMNEFNHQLDDGQFPGHPWLYHVADYISHTNDGDQYDSLRSRVMEIKPTEKYIFTENVEETEEIALDSQLAPMKNKWQSSSRDTYLQTIAIIEGLDRMKFYAETSGRVDPNYDSTSGS